MSERRIVRNERTCRRDLSDKPRLASQHAQARHITLSMSVLSNSEESFPLSALSLTEEARSIVREGERGAQREPGGGGGGTERQRHTETETAICLSNT